MMRRLLATVFAAPLFLSVPARADLPVIDTAALGEWAQQLKDGVTEIENQVHQITQLEEQIDELKQTISSLTDIPSDLMSSVSSLLSIAIQNPLGDLNLNLRNLMFNSGYGSCANASSLLSMSHYHTAVGSDLNAAWLNGTASRLSGISACTEGLLNATQGHLSALMRLMNQLQDCKDTACSTAMTGRIEAEVANINALHEQATLLSHQAQTYQWMAEAQHEQKQRADFEEIVSNTGGSSGSGGDPATTVGTSTDAPMFTVSSGD